MADVGRPTVMTELTLSKLEEAFSVGATDLEACFFANISKDSLYRYQKENPEFSERKEALKNNLKFQTKKNIAKFLQEGDKDMTKWYGEKKMSDEFKNKREVDINLKKLEEMSDEELDQMLEV